MPKARVVLTGLVALLAGILVPAGNSQADEITNQPGGDVITSDDAATTSDGAAQADAVVRDGKARFTMLSPTLIRVEYAGDEAFEDRPTFNAINRNFPVPSFTTSVENGTRIIKTSKLTLRYKQDSGKFTPDNLSVDLTAGSTPVTAKPAFGAPDSASSLGGWRRSLDGKSGAAKMFGGMLTRDGWYLLDDTQTALLGAGESALPRPGHGDSPYQDGYFLGYGHDYKQGLKDFKDLTGPPVMMPRWAFGIWWSKWETHSAGWYQNDLLPAFREHKVPLDVLVLDTDFKHPHFWNGWGWNSGFFPDPAGFLNWAHGQGLKVSANVHPSMVEADPKYAEAQATSGGAMKKGDCVWTTPFGCRVFDWSDPKQLKAYFDLHTSFEQQGVDNWWLDWCCDSSTASMAGITPDTWINSRYANRATAKGQRGFAFSRIGSAWIPGNPNDGSQLFPSGPWAEHRYSAHFTGDTWSTWDSLEFQAKFTQAEGSIGMPYVTHDIGGFNVLDTPQLYARWVQLGAFQPILRLHSDHAPRLPWEFPGAAQDSAEKFLRLREALVPYTYSLAKQAYDKGLPLTRALYLNYPEHNEAYTFDKEYLYGDDVLVAPVTKPGVLAPAKTSVWFPPGTWTDYFTGKSYVGPSTATIENDLSTMPVFIRSGGILPTRTDYVDNAAAKPLDQVTLDVATGANGSFSLYEDEGKGLGYRSGQSATTALSYIQSSKTLTIAPRSGSFTGAVSSRTWTVKFKNVAATATVKVNGATVPSSYDAGSRTLTAKTSALAVGSQVTIQIG